MQLLSDKSAKEDFQFKAKHKNPEGGLSEAGRKAYNRETGGNLKRPQPEGGSRRDSFCARMKGMKAKLTSAETARDPDSRINKSLRKWKCSYDMSEVKEAVAKRKGLWDNIRAKRERGEAPAKPGDADFPDAKQWKKVTQESAKEAAKKRCWKGYESVPGKKPYSEDSCRPISAGKKKTEKKADDEEEIKKQEGRIVPALFRNPEGPAAQELGNPVAAGVATSLLGTILGGLGGGALGALTADKLKTNPEKSIQLGLLLGGLGGGGVGGYLGYKSKQKSNDEVKENIKNLDPKHKTLADLYAKNPELLKKRQLLNALGSAYLLGKI